MPAMVDRFWSLVKAQRQRPSQEEAPQRTLRDVGLSAWASQSTCRDEFMPYLRAHIDAEDAMFATRLESHAGLAYAVGYRDALRELLQQFETWAGDRP